MVVRENRKLQSGLRARRSVVARTAFHDVPPVVHSAPGRRNSVDLLEGILPDVGDVESPIVESVAPRVSQPVRPDLAAPPGLSGERIVARDRVWRAGIDV